jgi:hypothetical protein
MQNPSLTPFVPSHNGHSRAYPAPNSRQAFLKSAPKRIGTLEDQAEALELRVGAVDRRVSELTVNDIDRLLVARLDALVEAVARLEVRLRRVEKRSLRSRRKLVTLVDQVASTLD